MLLLRNIHNGRLERAQRVAAEDRARQDQADRDKRDRRAAEKIVIDEAALVTVELFGGGGYGDNGTGPINGTSISLRLINGTTKPVTNLGLTFEPHIRFKDRRALPGSLSAGEHKDLTLETHDYVLPRDEASGARLPRYRCRHAYSLGSRSWSRVEDEPQTEVHADEAARRAPSGTARSICDSQAGRDCPTRLCRLGTAETSN
ncbi:hypothetical protein [uncultured Jatrophihabitans sp.]|uniref:hypothetical protein n=1 Tax=uncultured Jatrophihabitans sp. TaxID=1610747 RepID=UPI0035CA3DC0